MCQRRLTWWLASLGTLLVILIAVLGYFVISTVGSFVAAHPAGCLPSDFPTYPAVQLQEIDQTFAVPGSIAQCRTRLISNHQFEEVRSFYRAELVTGAWETTRYVGDIGSSTINFDRRSHPLTNGVISIYFGSGITHIDVQLSP